MVSTVALRKENGLDINMCPLEEHRNLPYMESDRWCVSLIIYSDQSEATLQILHCLGSEGWNVGSSTCKRGHNLTVYDLIQGG